ncbi:MAG: amino acid ABC transporter substrate-binding protein [Litorilinea sp.]|nr:MAG: amino acid ABC transporter substrate-binding protein [Litorilinea sp.]
MRKGTSLLVTMLLLLSLILAACGGGAEPTPTPTTAPAAEPTPTEAPAEATPTEEPTPAEEATPEEAATEEAPAEEAAAEIFAAQPVKIGVLIPLTGALAEFGPAFQNAAELARKHLAEAGYEIELVFADTETAPQPAVDVANQLVSEGVHALIGAAGSGQSQAVAESVAVPNQIPQISYASTSPLLTSLNDNDFFFRTVPSDALQGPVLAEVASALGYETVSIFYIDNAYGQGLAESFSNSFSGTVAASVPIAEEAPSYQAELSQAASDEAQALVAISYPRQAVIYLREAIEGGYFDTFLFVDGTKSDKDIPEAVGAEAIEGMYGTAPGSVESDSLTVFNQAYEAEYGEVPPLPFMTNVYDGVVIASLAAFEAQVAGEELSGVAVRDHLRSVAGPEGEVVGAGVDGLRRALELLSAGEDINYEGAAGSQDFDENGDVATPIEIWRYENGRPVTVQLVNPGEPISLEQ